MKHNTRVAAEQASNAVKTAKSWIERPSFPANVKVLVKYFVNISTVMDVYPRAGQRNNDQHHYRFPDPVPANHNNNNVKQRRSRSHATNEDLFYCYSDAPNGHKSAKTLWFMWDRIARSRSIDRSIEHDTATMHGGVKVPIMRSLSAKLVSTSQQPARRSSSSLYVNLDDDHDDDDDRLDGYDTLWFPSLRVNASPVCDRHVQQQTLSISDDGTSTVEFGRHHYWSANKPMAGQKYE